MLYFVTGNDKKWSEIEAVLSGSGIEIERSNIDLPELQGPSLEEIAIKKAHAAFQLLKTPLIIEDTALCFNSLNGLPGAYIKWFLDALKPAGLVKMLNGFDSREAEAVCTMAYHNGNKVQIFQGKTSGFIANSPQGSSESFGWDPIFIPTDFNTSNLLSYAQLDKKIKNEISHRGKALQKLMDHLKEKEKE